MVMSLAALPIGKQARVERVGGGRRFRRRLMEIGIVPGTELRLTNVAPLGDPVELEARRARLSIRREEARAILVEV